MTMMDIHYCAACGGHMIRNIPVDDDRQRSVCPKCGFVHYLNPKMVVGCIPVEGDRVLMCRRDIPPRKGKWTLPAGYLEMHETVQEGAARETFEETNARVKELHCYRLFNIVHVGQIYLMFTARLASLDFRPTRESSEVRLFSESDIPWDDLAFKVITATLADYYKDAEKEKFRFRVKDIYPD